MTIPESEWVWMPHAAHLCVASSCQFRLATRVGEYIVSTVGEYVSPIKDDGGEFREIGYLRKYETMVFGAVKSDNECCPWKADVCNELETQGYNDPAMARIGHLALCKKYAGENGECND